MTNMSTELQTLRAAVLKELGGFHDGLASALAAGRYKPRRGGGRSGLAAAGSDSEGSDAGEAMEVVELGTEAEGRAALVDLCGRLEQLSDADHLAALW